MFHHLNSPANEAESGPHIRGADAGQYRSFNPAAFRGRSVYTRIAPAILAAITLLPFTARAEEPKYTYVDAAYVRTDIDGISGSADGFLLRGSVGIVGDFFLFADYADQGIHGVDIQEYTVGAGYAWSMTDTTDLYGKVSYERAEADYQGFGIDDDGYGLGIGIRSFVTDQLELEAAVNYTDLSDSGDDTALALAARWYFIDQLAVGVEAAFGQDATTYGIGLRWQFGN